MEWWGTMTLNARRVWNGVAVRIGFRKRGIMKLKSDVRACKYDDVRVMWDLLKKNETRKAQLGNGKKKRPFWTCFGWARCSPCFGHRFWWCHTLASLNNGYPLCLNECDGFTSRWLERKEGFMWSLFFLLIPVSADIIFPTRWIWSISSLFLIICSGIKYFVLV